jgi:small subunit ribosomal protein S1
MTKDNGGEDFAALLEEFDKKAPPREKRPEVGQLVRGKVISVGREAVFVALGPSVEGILDLVELLDEKGNLTVKEGDVIEARVAEIGDKTDQVILRRMMRTRGPEARADLQRAFELGIPVEGTVSGVNKGGLDVNVAGVRGFCPISQLELRSVDAAAAEGYVGRKLMFKVTRHEEDRRGVNLVLSRRALLEADAEVRGAETRGKLSVGAVVSGVVTAVKDFGAFVDLGGIEGMLPASELGFQRGQRPTDVLSVGQHLQVQVLDIKPAEPEPALSMAVAGRAGSGQPGRPPARKRGERISLSLKALERDPWEEAPTRFAPGTKVVGRVTNVEAFGAFVELSPGVEGLVHVGELSGGKQVRHARELVKIGDEREVTVLAIDPERRRISLGVGDRSAETVSPEDLARASSPGKLGTLGDLLKNRKP